MRSARVRLVRGLVVGAALAVVLPLAGCLDYDEVLTVAPDSSGTFAVDLKLDLGFITEVKKIDPQPESEDSGDVKNFVTKEEILKDCEVPGVTVKSCTVEELGPHKSHVKLELAFKDLDALRAVRFMSDRDVLCEDKGGDSAVFVYRYNARSVLNMLGMVDSDEKDPNTPKEQLDKEQKIKAILDEARKSASARFLVKLPGKVLATNGTAEGETAARWAIDKKNPKAQAALLTEPLRMDATLSKKDLPFWQKEVEAAKKRAEAEKAELPKDPQGTPKPDAPKPDAKPDGKPRPGAKPGLGEGGD